MTNKKIFEIVEENNNWFAKATVTDNQGHIIITKKPVKDENGAKEYLKSIKKEIINKKTELYKVFDKVNDELEILQNDLDNINKLID